MHIHSGDKIPWNERETQGAILSVNVLPNGEHIRQTQKQTRHKQTTMQLMVEKTQKFHLNRGHGRKMGVNLYCSELLLLLWLGRLLGKLNERKHTGKDF